MANPHHCRHGILIANDCEQCIREAVDVHPDTFTCPRCGSSLQYTQEGDSTQGEGYELWCPSCHWREPE